MLGIRRRGFETTSSPATASLGVLGRNVTVSGQTSGSYQPGNYPLELVLPRAAGTRASTATVAGTATPSIGANHRIFKAYPGLEYNIRAVVIGGAYPYTFALSGGVSWLSIDENTGVISGTAPSVPNGTTYTPTITVTDASGAQSASSPWTITVTTVGFKFVGGSGASDSNDGTLSLPWATFSRMKTASSAGDITYFRTGTYTTNITPDALAGKSAEFVPIGNWCRIDINGSQRSVQWLAYPGESPIIDGGYVESVTQGNLVRVTGSSSTPIYIDGIEFQNYYHIGLQCGVSGHYEVFRRLNMHGVAQAINGGNSSCIDSLSNATGPPRFYVAYQDCNFHDSTPGGIKIYWQYKSLIEDCLFVDCGGNSNAFTGRTVDFGSGGPDHKAVCGRFEVRTSVFSNRPTLAQVADGSVMFGASHDAGFGGNMNTGTAFDNTPASGEVRFNKFGNSTRSDLRVVDMNNFGSTGNADEIYIYRNTGIGRWHVQNSGVANTGPFRFYRNVIINDVGASAPDRITADGDRSRIELGTGDDANLTAPLSQLSQILDEDLNLTAAYDSQRGQVGAEI
jgi:hypothetical protein